ncbi:MAG TPA: cbb3-type cytochrome c oxidase subunit I, partial [Nitrococcus sp.]|nr:cbb3-type cytochrome c oxidase subunit I [Nitrococcus sp.]
MSVITVNEGAPDHYFSSNWGLRGWLLTKDHKRIAWLYTLSITLFFFLGGFAILFVRLELMSPHLYLMGADTYNRLFTEHGIIMVWFFLIPSIPATLGNFLMPLMLGA